MGAQVGIAMVFAIPAWLLVFGGLSRLHGFDGHTGRRRWRGLIYVALGVCIFGICGLWLAA